MSRKSRHVVPNPGGGWSVRNTGASRASRIFETQADAVRYARAAAKNDRAELYVHRRDGTVAHKDSYGSGTDLPRDKRQ
jgi:hypothetical protein